MKNYLQKITLLIAIVLLGNLSLSAQTCDTISNFSSTYSPVIIPLAAPNWGYVAGHNSFLDVAKAEYYNYSGTNTHVNGAIMLFGYAFTVNPFATVTATVWDGTGGTPGTVLGQKDILIQDIMTNIAGLNPTYVEFDNPVELIGNDFFIGFTMTAGTDTVAMVTNTPGDVPIGFSTAWEQQSNGNWFNYNASWGFDATHAMFPILASPPEAVITPSNKTACAGATITYDGTNSVNANTYEWIIPGGLPATSTAASPSITYNTPGIYDLTLIVSNDCISDTLTLTQEVVIAAYCPPTCDLQTTIVSQSPSCNGGNDGFATTQTSGGTAPYTYAWSNGQTTDTAFTLSPGTNYDVTITDANGCFLIALFDIGNPPVLTVNSASTQPTTCNGTDGTATAVVSGGVQPYSYMWGGGQTSATITGLGQGNYACTITDANGCIQSVGVTISDGCTGCNFTINPILTNASCGSPNGSIDANVTGATSTLTYAWSNSAGNMPVISGLAAGTYSVTVNDAIGCTDSAFVAISQSGAVTINMTPQDDFCSNSNASITTTVGGGASPYTYAWNNGDSTASIDALMSGTYILTVTDANGCAATSSIAVTSINNAPIISTTQTNVTCFGADDGTVNMSISGGNTPFSVFWSPLNINAQNLNSLAAGSYNAVVADQAGCLATTTVVITQPDSMSLITASTPTTSNTGAANVNVSGGTPPFTFAWNNGGTTQIITNLVTGAYTVTVTDSEGCTNTANVTVQDFTSNTNGIDALNTFNVFPNPSNGQFTVQLDFEVPTEAQIQVVDMLGRNVFEQNIDAQSINLPIDVQTANGLYFLTIQTESGKAVKRILVNK